MKLKATLTGLLALAVALPVLASAGGFSDVPGDLPGGAAIQQAQQAGLMLGHRDGTFQPGRETTLKEWQAIASRLAEKGWSRAQTAVFLTGGLQAVRQGEAAGMLVANPVAQVIEPTTSTTAPATTTTAPPPVPVAAGLEDITAAPANRKSWRIYDTQKVKELLENSVEFLEHSVDEKGTASFKLRVSANPEILEIVRLRANLTATWRGLAAQVAPNQAGVLDYQYQCSNRLSEVMVRWQLGIIEPAPDAGGYRMLHTFWVRDIPTPTCQTLQAYHIGAVASLSASYNLSVRVSERLPDEDGGRQRVYPVEPWQYRLRTTQNGCYDHTGPWQTGGGSRASIDYDRCLQSVSGWWVELHWPNLNEYRQTHQAKWEAPELADRQTRRWYPDRTADYRLTEPGPITYNQGAGIGDGFYEREGHHRKRLSSCRIPDITQCPGYARVVQQSPQTYEPGAWTR